MCDIIEKAKLLNNFQKHERKQCLPAAHYLNANSSRVERRLANWHQTMSTAKQMDDDIGLGQLSLECIKNAEIGNHGISPTLNSSTHGVAEVPLLSFTSIYLFSHCPGSPSLSVGTLCSVATAVAVVVHYGTLYKIKGSFFWLHGHCS